MSIARMFLACAAAALLQAAAPSAQAAAPSAECLRCHAALASRKVVHAAMNEGCETCHAELDASTTPHKSKGKFAGGLKAEGPALCTSCHEPALFEGRFVHAPVVEGKCTLCHDAHSSDFAGLAPKAPAQQCLDCHTDVKKRPHMIVGFSAGGHPLGDAKKVVEDPLRGGKPFYCAACHEPHRSTRAMLMRFEGKGTAACQKCHKM